MPYGVVRDQRRIDSQAMGYVRCGIAGATIGVVMAVWGIQGLVPGRLRCLLLVVFDSAAYLCGCLIIVLRDGEIEGLLHGSGRIGGPACLVIGSGEDREEPPLLACA